MEQHPVPQNVTTFQFRLIGDMTIKQFGYLAGGAILAYISYKLPLPLFLNWPLAILFAVAGFGFAFIPIEERPMDVWVLSFFKSIYSPTQYVWNKRAPAVQQQTAVPATPAAAVPTDRRGNIVQSLYGAPAPTAASKRKGPFDWLLDMFMPMPKVNQPTQSVPPAQAPAQSGTTLPSRVASRMDFQMAPVVRKTQETIAQQEEKERELERHMQDVQKELQEKQPTDTRLLELQNELAALREERKTMEEEIIMLRRQIAPANSAPPPQGGTYVATPASRSGPSVRIITADRAVGAGLPRLTTFANVVTGIVKDGEQNLLPGVLVTVKDDEGVPLRALKTNRLGQFAASTPLPNGTYVIEIEDPRLRYAFDRAQVTLNGTIVPALEIFAKSQKEISRAKLEKEIFGTKNE